MAKPMVLIFSKAEDAQPWFEVSTSCWSSGFLTGGSKSLTLSTSLWGLLQFTLALWSRATKHPFPWLELHPLFHYAESAEAVLERWGYLCSVRREGSSGCSVWFLCLGTFSTQYVLPSLNVISILELSDVACLFSPTATLLGWPLGKPPCSLRVTGQQPLVAKRFGNQSQYRMRWLCASCEPVFPAEMAKEMTRLLQERRRDSATIKESEWTQIGFLVCHQCHVSKSFRMGYLEKNGNSAISLIILVSLSPGFVKRE